MKRDLDPLLALPAAGWLAQLALDFDRVGPRTRLARCQHQGPLVVQRPLYPEGEGACHAIVVHPPGGIAGGDRLELSVRAAPDSHAVLTTPGAGKLYKGAGRRATQEVHIEATGRAVVEYLPQETMVFDGADASLELALSAGDDALVLAWEIVTLGREAMGERFTQGLLHSHLAVSIGGEPMLDERGTLDGGSAWLDSPVGWRSARTSASFIAAGRGIDDALLERSRAAIEGTGRVAALSRLEPCLLVARYLGPTPRQAREIFGALWRVWRPALAGCPAIAPRIWST